MARPYKGWSVFWRGDKGRWVLSRDGKQKLLPRTLKNSREAHKWAMQWLQEKGYLEIDGTAKRSDKTNTIAELADQWIEWRKKHIGKRWEPATISNNASHVKRKIKPGIGKHVITDCTSRVIATWIQSLTNEAPNTVRNLYRTLVSLFDDSIEQGFCDLEFNPAKSPLVTKVVPQSMTKAQELQADTELSIEQCQVITSDPRVPLERRVKYICAITGVLRDGELMGLTWGAFDFERGIFRIIQTSRIRRFATDPSLGKPKTRRSRRTIPLHSAAKAALLDWRRAQVETLGAPVTDDMPVFPGRDKDTFTRVKAAKQLREDLERLGIPSTASGVNLVFHHLRHTALNILRRAKVEPLIRDYLAGHAPKSVGDANYQHSTLEEIRADVELIPLTWAGPRGRFDAHLCATVTETQEGTQS